MISLGLIALLVFALAWRLVSRMRARHLSAESARRDSFNELLAQAESDRIRRQVEAEGDDLPWR